MTWGEVQQFTESNAKPCTPKSKQFSAIYYNLWTGRVQNYFGPWKQTLQNKIMNMRNLLRCTFQCWQEIHYQHMNLNHPINKVNKLNQMEGWPWNAPYADNFPSRKTCWSRCFTKRRMSLSSLARKFWARHPIDFMQGLKIWVLDSSSYIILRRWSSTNSLVGGELVLTVDLLKLGYSYTTVAISITTMKKPFCNKLLCSISLSH